MSALFLTSASGWAAAFLIIFTIALPFAIRTMGSGTYRTRLMAHAWIGCAILALCLVHLIASLNPRIIGTARSEGIALAIAALGMVVVQLIAGRRLNSWSLRHHTLVRRLHFIGMVAIVVLAGAHMVLNSPLIGAWF